MLLTVAALSPPIVGAAVDVDGDLLLGVWSPQRTRFLATVPVCISRGPDEPSSAYRITVSGTSDAATNRAFGMVNDIGDDIPYRVRWYDDVDGGRRENLRPDVPSRRAYAYRTRAECAAGSASGLEARARERDVDRAPPGIYRDTVVLTVSPI